MPDGWLGPVPDEADDRGFSSLKRMKTVARKRSPNRKPCVRNIGSTTASRNRIVSPPGCLKGAIAIVLEPDVAAVFKSSKTVNALLRSVISAMPQSKRNPAD